MATVKTARRTVIRPIAMQATGNHVGMSIDCRLPLVVVAEPGHCCSCRDQRQRDEENVAEGGSDVEEPDGGDDERGAAEEDCQKDQ